MADRVVAVIGAHHGPWVQIDKYPAPHIRVTRHNGTPIVVELAEVPFGPTETVVVDCDGRHPIPRSRFARINARESVKTLICHIESH